MQTTGYSEAFDSLFTVAPGRSFLDAVVSAILEGRLPVGDGTAPDKFQLPDYTILLPTRRAVRAMQAAFLKAAGPDGVMLLPRLRPISQGEEEATLISAVAGSDSGLRGFEIPPAIDELERRLVLMQLVQRWTKTLASDGGEAAGHREATPSQVARLAGELAAMMDMVETENVSLDRLADLVPDSYAAHWQKTVDFLQIITAWWPQYLNASSCISAVDRRNRIILAEADRLRISPPESPVIVAGVTGSVPATAGLIKAVYELPNGAVVLPGLDRHLSQQDIQRILADHPEHPQCGMLRVLQQLGAQIEDVQDLNSDEAEAHFYTRSKLISEALRPAPSTSQWHSLPERVEREQARSALDGVTLLTVPSAQDEAEAIALILRQTAEQSGQTAALVTPDRVLARRVGVRLEAWSINVDDSAGRPFAKTVSGAFLELVINAVATGFEPCALMALLKHPLCRLGRHAFDIRRSARALEIAAFRTAYLGDGLDGLESALEKASQDVLDGRRRDRAVSRLSQEDWTCARELVRDVKRACDPLTKLFSHSGAASLRAFAEGHLQTAEALVAMPGELKAYIEGEGHEIQSSVPQSYEAGARELWRGEAGETGARLFASLIDPGLPEFDITCTDYPDFYRTLLADEVVRPRVPRYPRIFIWGPYEARLQRPDVVVLGSLNEGTWPQSADAGLWLNRLMLADVGLPQPEEKIGYAAHDFTQLLGACEVYLTRAEMVDGTPTVPSRWLMRLQAVLAGLEIEDILKPQQPWLAWARFRDTAQPQPAAMRPAPKPPLALRPRSLSVSNIESWIANPYAIFASHVLGLDALPPLGTDPDASLKGSVIHEVLGLYLKNFSSQTPRDPASELVAISERLFRELRRHPRIAAFWIERFRRFAEWFGAEDEHLRAGASKSLGEISGSFVIDAPGGPFTLKARADRIDVSREGLAITDYKTAANLSDLVARAKAGRAPQLFLEALIAERGGFSGIDAAPVSMLRYVSVAGGDPPGAVNVLKLDDVHAAICEVERELNALVARFDNVDTPYLATRRAQFRYNFDAYAHLARVAEWSGEGQEGGAV